MKTRKTFFFAAIIALAAAFGFLLGRTTDVPVFAQKKSGEKSDLLSRIKKEKVSEIKVWRDRDEKEFVAVIRKVDESPTEDSMFNTADKLTIYNGAGKILYEHKDFNISGLEFDRFLSSNSSELMFTINGGGTDNFIKIISHQNGKFTNVIDESEMQFRGGYFSMIQYRAEMKSPYFQPSQLIVIQQIGGADANPAASVFRTKDGKFQKVGEIKMQELGDFIENQIAQKKNAK